MPPIPFVRSANQKRFASPSQEPDPAALPVGLSVWLNEKDRPQPSVRSSEQGISGQGFASSGLPDGVYSLQYRGIVGIWSVNISMNIRLVDRTRHEGILILPSTVSEVTISAPV